MPKISVIMGIYNTADTLGEALDSLFNQTFQNFEVILCDDGSSDLSFQIAEEYQKAHPNRIRLLQNTKNMGLNYTLNLCLEKVSGEYVARMDGDDICDSTRFQKQVDFLESHAEYAIVSSIMNLFDANGIFRTTKLIEKPGITDLRKGNPHTHAAAMIRTEAIRKVNGYTESKWTMRVEDVDLWFKLYAAGYRGYNIQEPLYMMRDDREAVSRRKFRYRVNSTLTRLHGFALVKMPLKYYPLAFTPILIGLLPVPIYNYFHRKAY